MYMVFFRNIGIFHEHLTNKILDDVVKSCKPHFAKITVIMGTRGGIDTTVEATYEKK